MDDSIRLAWDGIIEPTNLSRDGIDPQVRSRHDSCGQVAFQRSL